MPTTKQALGAKGEAAVSQHVACPRCGRKRHLTRLPRNFQCADVICKFCGFLAQVKAVTLEPGSDHAPDRVLGAAWRPQQEQIIGGTSAGAPSWQGIWARAQSAHGGTLGFAGAPIYNVPAATFNDILIGANGLYPTTPGWDYNTGRGTPNITAFVNGA